MGEKKQKGGVDAESEGKEEQPCLKIKEGGKKISIESQTLYS